MAVTEGTTVRAVLRQAVSDGILPEDDLQRTLPRTTVMINGEVLDRETALDRRLKAGDIVNIEVSEMGGGGGRKDVGQILLTLAVIVVSAWVGGPAGVGLGLKSLFLRAVASAAVMAVGNAAIAALFAPETSSAKVNDRYALQSASNQYRPWSPFPLALGEVIVAPDLAAKTYTQAIGDDVWIHGILAPHFGACEVSEIKIGDTLVSSMGAGDWRAVEHLTPGPRDFAIYPNDVDQLDLSEELEATTSTVTAVVRATPSEGERFELDFFLPAGLHFQKDDGRIIAATVTITIRHREVDEEGAPVGAGTWTTVTRTLTSTTKEPMRVTQVVDLPIGLYEFEVKRSLKPDDNAKRQDRVAWTALRAIAFRKPVVDETLSLIEFAVRASALNQGTLAPITCRIIPKVPTWNGTVWTAPVASSNPAALVRWLLTGPAAARPLSAGDADVRLRTWSTLCDDYDWTCNIYLGDSRTQAEALGLIADAGRASLFWDGTQMAASPWVEKPAPRQLFAGDNLKDHRWKILYPEPVHALRVEFQNIDEGGEPDEVYVYADGYGEVADVGEGIVAASLVEALRLEGQKTAERAYRDGRWELGRRLHQRRVDTWTSSIEHLVSGYGDRVRLAWQRLDEGAAVRVRTRRWAGGLVTGLRLTEPVEFQAGESYAADLRLVDGVVTAVPIINPASSAPVVTREISFVTARSEATSPRAGDKLAFGVSSRVSEDVELIGIEPGEGLTASLTGIRYVAPLLIEGETAAIPPLQTRLTRQRAANPPTPILLGVQADPSGVRVSFAVPPWSGSPIVGFPARWRPTPAVDNDAGWLPLPTVSSTAGVLITPPVRALPGAIDDDEAATLIDIEIRAVTEAGQSSPNPLAVEGLVVREDPFVPMGLTVTPATRTAPDGSSHGVLVVAVDPLLSAVGTDVILEVRRYPPAGDPDPWESAGLSLTSINPVGDVLGLRAATAYGVRAAFRSASGWISAWTDEETATVPAGSLVAGDVTPITPGTVAGTPTLSITTTIAPDGTQTSRLFGSWTAPAYALTYIVEIDDGTIVQQVPLAENAIEDRIVATGPTYRYRVKAVSRTGTPSAAWSSWSASVAASGDTTAAGVLTSPSITALARRLVLQWVSPSDDDYAGLQIVRNTTGTAPSGGTTPTYGATAPITGTIFADTDVAANVLHYYWGRSVDHTGNVGAWTSIGSASPTFVSVGGGDVATADPVLVTQYGVAASITGQAATATSSDFAAVTGVTRPAAYGTASDNQVPDPGFSRGLNAYWYATDWVATGLGGAFQPPVMGVFNTGVVAAPLSAAANLGHASGDEVAPGADQWFGAWIYIEKPGAGASNPTIQFASDFHGPAGYISSGGFSKLVSAIGLNQWVYFSGAIRAPAGATKANSNFIVSSHPDHKVWLTAYRIARTESGASYGARSGTSLFRTDGVTVLTQAEVRTAEGVAASITGQTAWATSGLPTARLTNLSDGGAFNDLANVTTRPLTALTGRTADNINYVGGGGVTMEVLRPAEAGANVTETRVAASITGQTAWATSALPTARLTNLSDGGAFNDLSNITTRPLSALTGRTADQLTYVSGGATVESLRPAQALATVGARSGTNLFRTDGTTVLTQAEVRTAEGVAASITGQAATATSSDFAAVTGVTRPAAYGTASDNQVPDPGFARGINAYWYTTDFVATGLGGVGQPPVQGVFNTGAVAVPISSNSNMGHGSSDEVAPGADQWFGVWVYIEKPGAGSTNPSITFASDFFGDAGYISSNSFSKSVAAVGLNQWVYFSGAIRAPAGANRAASNFVFTNHPDHKIWITGFRIARTESGASYGARSGTSLFRTDGTTVLTQAEVRTVEGVAASITGQGSLATASTAAWGSQVSDRPTELTDGRVAAALDSSGDLARDLTTARLNSSNVLRYTGGAAYTGDLAATVGARSGTNLFRTDGSTVMTQAEVRTVEGVAASITGQGSLATASTAAWGSQVSGRPTELTDGRVVAALDASGAALRLTTASGLTVGSGITTALAGQPYTMQAGDTESVSFAVTYGVPPLVIPVSSDNLIAMTAAGDYYQTAPVGVTTTGFTGQARKKNPGSGGTPTARLDDGSGDATTIGNASVHYRHKENSGVSQNGHYLATFQIKTKGEQNGSDPINPRSMTVGFYGRQTSGGAWVLLASASYMSASTLTTVTATKTLDGTNAWTSWTPYSGSDPAGFEYKIEIISGYVAGEMCLYDFTSVAWTELVGGSGSTDVTALADGRKITYLVFPLAGS